MTSYNQGVEGKFCQFHVSLFILVLPRVSHLWNFVIINTDLFYISCANLRLISYPEVKLFQFLLRHMNVIPSKFKKTYEKWKKMLPFLDKQYFWLKFTGKTDIINIFPKKSKSVMWSHWWRDIDVNIIFLATENNFRFPNKLVSGDLKFLKVPKKKESPIIWPLENKNRIEKS